MATLAARSRVERRAVHQNDAFEVTPRYRAYVLFLLIAVNVCGWVDRNVFSILLESIRRDLGFSDTQLALLGGTAVGIFYAACGLPIAWLADRSNRRTLLAGATAVWSLMTALSGLATGFFTLFCARVGVGIGEAGSTPPSHSLVADYFAPARRALALGILSLYVPFGFLIGYLAGGWLDELFGWRAAFLVVGLPGVLLAVVVRLTLREPPRGHADGLVAPAQTPSLRSTLRYFCSRRTLRQLALAGAVHSIGGFAAAVWLPSYLIRQYGIGSGEAGTWMAIAYGVGGGIGVVAGGYCADRAAKAAEDERWYLWIAGAVVLATVPFSALIYISNHLAVAVAAIIAATLIGHMFLGPVVAMLQALAGLRRRAVASACYLFLVNLVSLGVGPLAVGIASDRLVETLGNDSLRYALLVVVTGTSLWASVHLFLASRSLRGDLARVQHCE